MGEFLVEYFPETVGLVRQRSIRLFNNYTAFSAPAKRITRFVEIKFLYNKNTFFKVNFHPKARNYSSRYYNIESIHGTFFVFYRFISKNTYSSARKPQVINCETF